MFAVFDITRSRNPEGAVVEKEVLKLMRGGDLFVSTLAASVDTNNMSPIGVDRIRFAQTRGSIRRTKGSVAVGPGSSSQCDHHR